MLDIVRHALFIPYSDYQQVSLDVDKTPQIYDRPRSHYPLNPAALLRPIICLS